MEEKGINSYTIRKKGIVPQGTLTKIKIASGESFEEINKKLDEYKENHDGKEFVVDVSTKTIEDLCQLLQCQPSELIEWEVDLKPELSYEARYKA